ncbi:MAG TPA: DUF5615 family PIN-like protein [Herpetosiphonaceae bacterium]|nr:DUF5615 family PIN-like protein [Herpetosiphonaceae bacterium]
MSSLKYLFDENLDPRYKATLSRRRPEIDVLQVGESDAPPRGTKDPEILVYLEATHRVLVTNNRDSMPDHLQEHWAGGGVCWGVFTLKTGPRSIIWLRILSLSGQPRKPRSGSTLRSGSPRSPERSAIAPAPE